MADIWGAVGFVWNWVGGIGLSLILLGAAGIGIWGYLFIRRKRMLNKNVLEMFDLGNGHFDFRMTSGGWFKQHLTFFKLWDYGHEDLFRLKDGTPVYDVSHTDYRTINGKSGIVIIRNPHDPKFAIPIAKFHLAALKEKFDKHGRLESVTVDEEEGIKALAQIAPIELRNAGVHAIEEVNMEMRDVMSKWMPVIAIGTIAIIIILVTIFNTQYGSHMVDVSSKTLLQATQIQCSNAAHTAASTAP